MKKLIIVLMVVAVTSFLFVGCLPGVTPDPDPDPTPDPTPTTVAPVITGIAGISLTGSAEYINAGEADDVIVTGTAPTLSEVKVYVDGVTAGTGNTGNSGVFSVVIAEADLGADGAKTLYATATDVGLPESAHSVEYKFVLDTVAPKATELKATGAVAASVTTTYPSGSEFFDGWGGRPSLGGTGTLTAGTWYIAVLGISGAPDNVTITDPDGVVMTYTVSSNITFNGNIPGVTFKIAQSELLPGKVAKVVVGTAIASRATVLFDEEITYASAATAGNYMWQHTAWLGLTFASSTTFVGYIGETSYFRTFTGWGGDIAQYDGLAVIVNGMTDLAGNTQTTGSSLNTVVDKASLTSLALQNQNCSVD